jgi:hypothetical protein
MSNCDANTRFQLTVAMLGAVVLIVLVVMVLSAFDIVIPEFVSGVVVMGFMTMLSKAYDSYFKAREELQAARIAGT